MVYLYIYIYRLKIMNYLLLVTNELKTFIPELYLSFSIFILLIIGVFIKSNKQDISSINTITSLCIQTLTLTFILILNNPFNIDKLIIFNGFLVIDYVSSMMKLIILLSTISVLYISYDYFKTEKIISFEYSILILLATLGMILLISSYDFLSLYLAIELQSLSLYILASFKKDSEFSTEAGLKYFILGALSSGILLFGISIIYGLTGSTNYEIISHLLINVDNDINIKSTGIIIATLFIASALLFKLAAVPFHMWAPDVYEGSPTIVTAFFAIVPKLAIITLSLQVFTQVLFTLAYQSQIIFIFAAIASMIIGALGALQQRKIKRLLAYSAIGHVGYMLIGLACNTPESIQAIFLYIIVYMIMSVNIFTAILSIKNNNSYIQYIYELKGLSKYNGLLAITISLGVLSMAGIPPLAGFISKLYIFLAAIYANMYILAIIAILTSVIGAVYYLRLVKIIFFDKEETNINIFIDKQKSIVLAISFLFITLFILNPSFLLLFTHNLSYNLSL